MDEGQPDRTALASALVRAAHLLVDDEPRILRDEFAGRFAGFDSDAAVRAALAERQAALAARRGPELARFILCSLRGIMTVRNRHAEDLLAKALQHGTDQYVLLGAGLDSFAYRRRDLAASLRVFEIDHPSTQQWKRARLDELTIPLPDNLTLVPVDFEHQSLRAALEEAGYRLEAPGFFSWLGVTQYLTEAATLQTLREIAAMAQGTEIVFEYTVLPSLLDGQERQYLESVSTGSGERGAPWYGFYEPGRLAGLVQAMGFTDVTAVSPDDLNARYFTSRQDGLRTPQAHHFIHARLG